MRPHINNINTFSPPQLCLCPTSLYSTLLCPTRLSARTPSVPHSSPASHFFFSFVISRGNSSINHPMITVNTLFLVICCLCRIFPQRPTIILLPLVFNSKFTLMDPPFDISFLKFPFTSRVSRFARYHDVPGLL